MLFFQYPTQTYYSLKERLSMLSHEYAPFHFFLAVVFTPSHCVPCLDGSLLGKELRPSHSRFSPVWESPVQRESNIAIC